MGSWRILVFLSHILINVVGLSISQVPAFIFVNCYEGFGNYTTNSTYQTNLNTLLSSLFSNTDSYGFYSSSLGENADRVNAIVLCRGDIDLDTCRGCIDNGTSRITQDCPNRKHAVGWYDFCMVRYSNESINGLATIYPAYCGWTPADVLSVNQFNHALSILLDRLNSQAVSGGTGRKFAIGNETGPDDGTIYGLVQCTPDLSEDDCGYCLEYVTARIPNCTSSPKEAARLDAPSCNVRYDNQLFFTEIPVDSPTPDDAPAPVDSIPGIA